MPLPTCFLRASPAQRAGRPRCMVPGCGHRVMICDVRAKNSLSILSLHCKEHGCRQRLGNVMCTNAKDPGSSRFCHDHGLCLASDCGMPRVNSGTSQDYAYCHGHTCYIDQCRLKRLPGAKTCSVHTPRCMHPACSDPCADGSRYCAGHGCADAACGHASYAGPWCPEHGRCTIAGCGSPRTCGTAADAGKDKDKVCAGHAAVKCVASGCGAKVDPSVGLCPKHKCGLASCSQPQDREDHPYCAGHTCQRPNCVHLVRDTHLPVQARYCAAHSCSLPTCTLAAEPGLLCMLHTCAVPSCTAKRASEPIKVADAKFCSSHECAADACHMAARAGGSSRFCADVHACTVPGCPGARIVGIGGVAICASHVAEASRMAEDWKIRAAAAAVEQQEAAAAAAVAEEEEEEMERQWRLGGRGQPWYVRVAPPSPSPSLYEENEVLGTHARKMEEERRRVEAAEGLFAGRGRRTFRGGVRTGAAAAAAAAAAAGQRRRNESLDSAVAGVGAAMSETSESSSGRTWVN